MTTQKIVVVGTGAVGGLYASRFQKARNTEVYTICRSNYEVVQKNGFHIDSDVYGVSVFHPTGVFRSISEAGESKLLFDYVVVTTKNTPETGNIAHLIRPLISENTAIVVIQNGIDIEPAFCEAYPCNPLISCVAIIIASQIESGKIFHRKSSRIGLGLFPKPEPGYVSQSLDNLSLILKDSEIPYDITPDIVCLRWFKLQWNCSLSPISILTGGCDTYYIQHEFEVEELVKETMLEIRSLGEKVLGFPQPNWVPYPKIDDCLVLTHDIHFKPSLLLDFERKNALELETTLGSLVRAAHHINFPIPRVKTLYALLKLADKKNRGTLPENPFNKLIV